MRRPDAPPLMVVVDDGAHMADQMAATLFFWFPRIEPGGIFVMEDIEPNSGAADKFLREVVPQMAMDVHFCGHPGNSNDRERFPTLRPLLQSIHCEMHICIFERNSEPAQPYLSKELSTPPKHALNMAAFKPN